MTEQVHPIRAMFPEASVEQLDELLARVHHTGQLLNEQTPDLSDPELKTLYEDPIFDMGIQLILWETRRKGMGMEVLLRNVVYYTVLSIRSERAKTMLRDALEGGGRCLGSPTLLDELREPGIGYNGVL